jgi:hypothetical protein
MFFEKKSDFITCVLTKIIDDEEFEVFSMKIHVYTQLQKLT